MSLQIAQVAVNDANIHFDRLYSYCVPPRLAGRIWPGSMVLVPFGRGNKPRMAVVLDVQEVEDAPDNLKTLLDAAPEEARLTPDLMELVRFLKERTFCTWFEAVKAVIPYGAQYRPAVENGRPVMQSRLTRSTERLYTLTGELPAAPKPGPRQLTAVQALRQGPLTARQLDEVGISKSTLDSLCKKGVLTACEQDKEIDLFAAIPFDPRPITLSPEQQTVFWELLPKLEDAQPHAALLHGVTGSGKTMVFLKLIERTLELGRRALVLVPEISLTPQMIRRLKSTFGSRLAVQHSALNNTERLLQWRRIQQGNADIVVGTRSAVFAPLQNIGLIIMDEEQEHTYQSESAPRYDAHDIAKKRAAMENSLLLFASATPLTETYHAAQCGRLQLVRLQHRYGGKPLPQVDFVDMRAELAAGNPREVSGRLAQELQKNLDHGEQSILLLNRRGYRTVAMCTACGHVLKCPHCSVPLVYHKPQQALMCHHCGHTVQPAPTLCPDCGGKLAYSGFGTQRVEEELSRLLPAARILRMDQDSTTKKNAHETMLAQFARHDYDILLGTQMVAKGLDFENVTLVGVLSAEASLYADHYRAPERTFSLLSQVVGRAGRGSKQGRAVIQTYTPNNDVIRAAAAQDYNAFYESEIRIRKLRRYPPFADLFAFTVTGTDENRVIRAAKALRDALAFAVADRDALRALEPEVLGPAGAPVVKVNNRYRYRVFLVGRNCVELRRLTAEFLCAFYRHRENRGLDIFADCNAIQ